MAILLKFSIIVVVGSWFAGVEAKGIPRYVNNGSTIIVGTMVHVDLGPEIEELDSNVLRNVTSQMYVKLRTLHQFKTMKCDAFGGEKSSIEPGLKTSLVTPRAPECAGVNLWACVKDSIFYELRIVESENPFADIRCHQMAYVPESSSYVLDEKITGFDDEWYYSGVPRPKEFLSGLSAKCGGFGMDFSSSKIQEFTPNTFNNMMFVNRVLLNNHEIKDVKIIENFPAELKSLSLSHDGISNLGNSLQRFVGLTHLNLSFNEIQDLKQGEFQKNTKLERLDLGNNKISILPEGVFAGLENLKWLDIENNLLKDVLAGRFNLPRLVGLNIAGNQIEFIASESFGIDKNYIDPTSEYYLDISRNPIEHLQNHALATWPKVSTCTIKMANASVEFIEGAVFDKKIGGK